jgi:hypothetical protein
VSRIVDMHQVAHKIHQCKRRNRRYMDHKFTPKVDPEYLDTHEENKTNEYNLFKEHIDKLHEASRNDALSKLLEDDDIVITFSWTSIAILFFVFVSVITFVDLIRGSKKCA